VLKTLGDVGGLRVLELGAGIGRFTGDLAKRAAAVTACDFMDTLIQENMLSVKGVVNWEHHEEVMLIH
jgi:phosphoethanolamine N-methyltransferase